MAQSKTASGLPASRRKDERVLDALVVCLAVLVVGVGAYGTYDLVVAPNAYSKGGEHANGRPRRATRGLLGSMFTSAAELCPGQKQVNVLVLGTDERENGGRADTIMLVMIRKDTKRVAAVSIPRDLMVRIPGRGYQKINAIYSYYRAKGTGEEMTARTVARILGVQVDFYIKTDVSKFAQLFDAVGGLDLYVDRDMVYRDRAGGLDINLTRGMHHLNGKQIEGFVRHRHDRRGVRYYSSDFERNQRQQYVLKELVRQKSNLATITRLPQIVHAVRDMIETDMSTSELVALGLLARQLDINHVMSRMLPTHARMSGAWYAVLEPERTRALMAEVDAFLSGGPLLPDTSPERNDEIGGGSLNPTASSGGTGSEQPSGRSRSRRPRR